MVSINTNLSSLIVQNNLSKSTNALNQAIERMTTGYKINHASDNAANYSIAQNMSSKISSYQIADENASMGLDMISTASESLELISNKLSRLRSLAEQASNGTYGNDSLSAIHSEVNAIVNEIERISSNTEYNGINLMKGIVSETTDTNFISKIDRRDTCNMTALSSINPAMELESGTYSISTAEELAQLATMTNNGKVSAGCEFVLANDIDLASYCSAHSAEGGWTPIGVYEVDDEGIEVSNIQFLGDFDGNGYVISNMTINRSDEDFQALFGAALGTIKNLGLENVNVKGRKFTAALAGTNPVNTENCYSTGTVNASGNHTGGLLGYAYNVKNCYSSANVTSSANYTGGLIGAEKLGGLVENSYTNGNINGTLYCGGLVGYATGTTIKSCYATGNVTGTNANGGICGYAVNGTTLIDSYSSSKVQGGSNNGGLVGAYNKIVNISNCQVLNSTSTLKGIFAGANWGGLDSNVVIDNCSYNSAISISTYVGGKDNSSYTDSGITTNTGMPNFTIDNNAKITSYDRGMYLQVGIDGNTSSGLNFDIGLDVNYVNRLRGIAGEGVDIQKYSPYADYISAVDSILSKVTAKQTEYGAVQNRLESALESISVARENLVSSRSTLQDADIAKESSAYIKSQILQQASATLLATANQTPSIALTLLGGLI